MNVLFPVNAGLSTEHVIARARANSHSVKPFHEEIISFLDSLSKKLFEESRKTPALAPLAFFIRRAHSKKLAADFSLRIPGHSVAVPQGIVFHIPPTNVDTLFLYTLSISLLAGNSNIVRISQNSGPDTKHILNVLFEQLEKFPTVANLITVVSFGRDAETVTSISRASDVRMIWGGDSSIESVRHSPIGVHTKDLAFPDRFSFSIVEASAWNSASRDTKNSMVEALYNDTYWFDQMACSSPQQLVIVSECVVEAQAASNEILDLLDVYAQSRYLSPEGQAINKMVAIVKAINMGSTGGTWNSNSLVTTTGISLIDSENIRPGAGFFSVQVVRKLSELINQIKRKTQTISYFGFSTNELTQFIGELNGRGVDRIVPIGKALDFSPIWDGKDLLFEMHRLVTVE